MQSLRVLFMDGYEVGFVLKEGSLLKFEANFIYLVTANEGERYLPMCNIRWFAQESGRENANDSQIKQEMIDRKVI